MCMAGREGWRGGDARDVLGERRHLQAKATPDLAPTAGCFPRGVSHRGFPPSNVERLSFAVIKTKLNRIGKRRR